MSERPSDAEPGRPDGSGLWAREREDRGRDTRAGGPEAPDPFGEGYTSRPPPGAFGDERASPGPGVRSPSAWPGAAGVPGPTPGARRLAGWWSRVGATLID